LQRLPAGDAGDEAEFAGGIGFVDDGAPPFVHPTLDLRRTRRAGYSIGLRGSGPTVSTLYVFPTRDGNPYTDRGFKTLWQRCVLAAIDEKVLSEDSRFTFHDLRAFYASKHKRDLG